MAPRIDEGPLHHSSRVTILSHNPPESTIKQQSLDAISGALASAFVKRTHLSCCGLLRDGLGKNGLVTQVLKSLQARLVRRCPDSSSHKHRLWDDGSSHWRGVSFTPCLAPPTTSFSPFASSSSRPFMTLFTFSAATACQQTWVGLGNMSQLLGSYAVTN